MAGNEFGKIFKIMTFGESHGPAVGLVMDGVPAGIEVNEDLIKEDLARRKPGQSAITTSRKEQEAYEILSGVFEGIATGTPIAVIIRNNDQRSEDYDKLKDIFRPSHADFTYQEKYGIRDHRGGGRSSARETTARVIAGSFAKMILGSDLKIRAYVSGIGPYKLDESDLNPNFVFPKDSLLACPDKELSLKMEKYILDLKQKGDSTGGAVSCIITGVPVGLGEPVFDKLEAELAKAMMSLPATKGFELGSGFNAAMLKGSEHNDEFLSEEGRIHTRTNNSGGVQGGITNGENIFFRVAFKPTSTILQDQNTVDIHGNETTLSAAGRHDPCVVPRAVPIVEAMAAIVLADHLLRNRNSKI